MKVFNKLMYHVVDNIVTYLHLVVEKCNITQNLEDGVFDDSGPLPRVPIVTCGRSSDGSYAHLKEPYRERAKGSVPRVHDAVLVGPSSLGSSHGRRPLKTSVPSTGYYALFSSSEKRGMPLCRRRGYKEIGSIGWVASVLQIQALCLSTARLVFPCFWSKGNNHRLKLSQLLLSEGEHTQSYPPKVWRLI